MAKLTPRFRKELPAAATEVDGAPGVQVTDPETGTSFTFYEFEYDLAHQLDGKQDYDEIIAWAAANYQHGLSPEAIDEFSKQLAGLGFLDPAGARPGAETGGDSAQLEWNQNVNTDQFQPGGAPANATAKADSSGGVVLSSDALEEVVNSGPVQAAVEAATSSGVPRPIGVMGTGSLSRGFSGERRQPPAPGEVVATPFEDVSMRFARRRPSASAASRGSSSRCSCWWGRGRQLLLLDAQAPEAARGHSPARRRAPTDGRLSLVRDSRDGRRSRRAHDVVRIGGQDRRAHAGGHEVRPGRHARQALGRGLARGRPRQEQVEARRLRADARQHEGLGQER